MTKDQINIYGTFNDADIEALDLHYNKCNCCGTVKREKLITFELKYILTKRKINLCTKCMSKALLKRKVENL